MESRSGNSRVICFVPICLKKLVVKLATMNQDMMSTVILNPAMVDNDDPVYPRESSESVRYKQHCLFSKVLPQIQEDPLLAL